MSENEDPQEINAASPLKQWFGGFAGALFAFFALFVVAHIFYCFFHWGGDENAATVSDWVSDVIYFGPFVFAWRTYRHKALSQRTRVAWLLISLAHFAFFVGNALWTYFELALNESPFPSWADAGYLAYYPFMLAGMVYIVDKMTSKEERVGFVLDSAIILIGGGLVIWYLLLVPIAQAADDDTLKTVLSLAYPIGDIVLLLGIASIALRRRGFKLSSPIALLLFGVVLNFIADIYFGYNNLQGVYKTGDPTDALYSVGLFPVILAAHYQYILATRGDIDQESTAPLMARRSSPWLTYIAVAAAYCVLITMGVTGFEFIPGVDIMMGALLSALLLVRQLIFIREKNNADAAVTKLQERIQGIYAAATDGIAVSGIDGRLLEFNDAFARMLGYDRCELLDGIGVSDVTAPESAQATIDARETALGSDKPVEYEKEYVRKDGSRFDASVTVFPVGGSNEQQAVAAIVHDITERKQTELRLRSAEERSQLALRINRDGIWDWDIPNKKYYYSPIWRELFGYSSDEAIDILPANSEEFFHPDDRHLSYELRDAIDRGQRNFDIEFRHRCKDGRYKWVRCRAEAMVDPSTGRLTRLIGLNTDIEEKKRAELEREVIGSILQGVSVTENLEDLLALIHCEIGRVIYADNCFVALYDKGSRLFKMQFFVDKFDEVPRASALEGTRSHYVFSTGQPLFLDSQNTRDYERQGAFHLVGSPPKFWLGTPLRTPSEVIGVLVVQSYDDDHTFTKRDLDFLTSVAGTVALAIQRKQTESRMLLQTVALESAANGVVITDNNGTIEWVNPSFTRLTGYSFEESVGNKPRMLKSGRTTANVYARLWNTITKGHVWQGELVNRRKDGSLYDEEMTITPVVGTDGKIDHFIAIKRDITERKQAEETLRISEEKHRVLFESNPLPAYVYDTKTLEFLTVNDAAVRHYGYSRDEFLNGLTLKHLWPQEKHAELLARVEQVGPDSATNAAPSVHKKNDGSIIDVEVTSHAIVFGGVHAEIVLINDITEHKAAQEAMRESEARFRDLFDNAPVAYHELDAQGRIVRVNHTEELMLGYSNDELRGKHVSELILEPESREAVAEKLTGNVSLTAVERTMIRKDGTHVPVLNEDRIIYDSSKKILGIRTTLQDISALKEAEQRLKIYNERLQQSNRELQDFAYVASHDLQEPLRKVQTFADRLGSKYSALLDATGLDYLERMRNAAGRMQTLIQDLLSFSRVTTKAQPFVPVDLEQITREVMSDLEVKIDETGALIETSGLPKVEADPLQMRQLIQNLVGNALKFRRKDVALLVTITGEKASLSAGNGNGNGAYRITVEDNGIGFDDKYTEKIFTVFQRLHGRTEYEGSGIGLAVCRKIVERHHGNITAHGRPGHGAQFIFTLPGHQQNTEVTH